MHLLALVLFASGAALAAQAHDSLFGSSPRRTQDLVSPWHVYEGEGCEVVEDGCIQTTGYPGNYTNSSCRIVARLSAYVLEPISFDTGNDALTVNGIQFFGNLMKRSTVFGQMLWNPTESNAGWKICPRSSCSTMVCPLGYAAKQGSQSIACKGLACNETADLDTCCSPKCTVPANFTSSGYALNANAGACPYHTYPYYGYYAEATCSLTCSTSLELFASGKDSPVSSCPSPGEYLLPQPCEPRTEGGPQPRWQRLGDCEFYGKDCVQTKGFPSPYTGKCAAWLVGSYEVTFMALDVEDGFDVVTVGFFEGEKIFDFTGNVAPEPFVLPDGAFIQLELDGSIERSGYRVCARPLCSMVSCPSGYLFMCAAMNVACSDVNCEDRNVTCCREATATELSGLNRSNDALSAGCLVNATTTTTTTTRARRQIVGVTTFEVNGSSFNSSTLLAAWDEVLVKLAQILSEDVVLFPDDAPDSIPELTPWMVGYQLQNVEADAGEQIEEVELPFTLPQLQSYLTEAWMNVSGLRLGDSVRVLANTATSGSGEFQVGVQPLCSDYDGWVDDWAASCIVYEILCTPFGTSTYERFSQLPGYYWYFYSTVSRANENDPDAREACCVCGGGRCTAGGFHLRGTNWDFCAPCAAGWYSNEDAGIGLSCTQCEPGQYSTMKAASPSCTGASVGHYACCFGVTDEAETPCAIGTFASQEGQSACTNCHTGMFSSIIQAASCADCALGSFAAVDGSTACTACPSGTFANVTGRSLCSDCPAGSTATTGQASCTGCDPGKYNSAAGSEGCISCALGHHAIESGMTQCEPCDEGYHADSMGKTICDACPPGQESSAAGATTCEYCPLGKSKSFRALLCSACAPGYYSPSIGDINCLPCDAGQYANESGASACVDCPHGRASGTVGLAECPACLPGQYIGTEGESACLQCIQGRFADHVAAANCLDCEPGYVAAAAGLTGCTACAPGRRSPGYGGIRCEDCSLGTFAEEYGMPECLACQVGRYALLPGLSACFACEPGRYAEISRSSECLQCESGRYAMARQSTSCRACSADLPGPPDLWTTMHLVKEEDGSARWDLLLAATNISSCGCKPGSQPEGAVGINYVDGGAPEDPIGGRGRGCKLCGEGLNCLGMGQLRILEGYAWDGELSVYDCKHAVPDACRGGVPGVCAFGRDETTRVCAECLSGWVSNTDGTCSKCSDFDYGMPILVCTLIVSCGFLGYMFYDTVGARKRPSLTNLLVLICMGQLLTIIQQLGIVSSIRVQWDTPLLDILDAVSAIGFLDLDVLRPGCMVSMNPFRSYSLRVLAVYAALFLVVVAHILSSLAQHGCRRSPKHWFVMLCALGTIIMTFFVSIFATMLGPLQCNRHPNAKHTIAWFPSVVCWEDGRHANMLAVGFSACILPVTFLAAAVWAAVVFPRKLKNGSPGFLTGWAFLFFRYHAGAYWYGPVQLARNALISVAPALRPAIAQALFLQLVMLVSLVIAARVMPWRAVFANHLELIMHFCFLTLLLCACCFIDDEPARELSIFGAILILLMPLGVLALVALAVFRTYRSRGKPYQFFLCHHKVGAGSFSRLLKMRLLKARGVTRKVFVDTDDLQNLSTLFDKVGQSTECLVAIHSSHLLTRPWCVGEITAAHGAKVCIQVVRMHLVERPTGYFIENFSECVPDIECLTENGLGLEQVEQALVHFQSLNAIHLPEELQDNSVTDLGFALLGRMSAAASHDVKAEAGEALQHNCLGIIADKKDLEAASTAFIFRELITPVIVPAHGVTASVLTSGQQLPRTASRVALMCTNGLFDSAILLNLLDLEQHAIILPLVCSSSFVFPTPRLLKESAVAKMLSVEQQDKLVMLMQSVFTEIAVDFVPAALGATEMVLDSRVQAVAKRFWSTSTSTPNRNSVNLPPRMRGKGSQAEQSSVVDYQPSSYPKAPVNSVCASSSDSDICFETEA